MARVSNRLNLDDDNNGMGWYADTSFRAFRTRGQGGNNPPPPQILSGIEGKSSSKSPLYYLIVPQSHRFKPTYGPKFWILAKHLCTNKPHKRCQGTSSTLFSQRQSDFLPNYFLFLISGHFIISSKVHIFWEGHKVLRDLHLNFVLCSASQN